MFGMEDAGRWALARRRRRGTGRAQRAPTTAVEHVARTLLRRYGVVFWRLLEREADWLPPWRDLLRVYRRLEGRGDIRGGRFVAGFSGEQFALPDAVATLREVRRKPASGALVSLSGADPLNLAGILTPGPRLAALTGNRLLYRDGLPIALLAAGEVQFLETLDAASEWAAHKALLRSAVPVRRVPPTRCPARRARTSPGFPRTSGRRPRRAYPCLAFRMRSSAKRARPALPAASMPLRELDGDAFGAVDEHQLAGMKIHDLVARPEPFARSLATSAATSSTAKQMWFMPILFRSRM